MDQVALVSGLLSLDRSEVIQLSPGGKLLGESIARSGDIVESVFDIVGSGEVRHQYDAGLLVNAEVLSDGVAQPKLVVDVWIGRRGVHDHYPSFTNCLENVACQVLAAFDRVPTKARQARQLTGWLN